ncbi:2-dehydro-3-deoxyphosphogluconate aldolase [Planococcus rifietoensis]|uniref:2-dehydro-3-deoxyphosphogluconate aldolase n=1 Tax=Planococcus rifietoensis TaxID=200991 RepID=A0A0U2YP91_9BACL|nr:bifunctional 4-hydroxy-2-oxoglutarate aldolase/2-dehydro-3-deoxy-phosphogluconate aldolase [Planococcus rifietoensis]ALS76442.1 2-dehydro-3-deoxyphosphogluconate aldolase [Planococcus rifietoensis]
MFHVLDSIKKHKIVAIIRTDSLADLELTVESLHRGGIRIVEVTLNTPGALEGIKGLKEKYPDLIVGAGTVLDPESARQSILSGAAFLLAPTLKESTIHMANRYGTFIVPGVLTPTEALTAYEVGAKMVKIFPARSVGPNYIKDLKGPLPHIDVMAVGGISIDNADAFFKAGCTALGIGSALVDNELVKRGDFQEIEKRARDFVEIADRATAIQNS